MSHSNAVPTTEVLVALSNGVPTTEELMSLLNGVPTRGDLMTHWMVSLPELTSQRSAAELDSVVVNERQQEA